MKYERIKTFILFLFLSPDLTFCTLSAKNCKEQLCSPKEKIYLQEKKSIKMCVDPNWMPFEHINSKGNYEGILADFMQLFSQKLETPFVLEKTDSYTQSRKYLKEGKCDIIAGEQATKEIKKDFLATKAYFISPRAFVTHIDALLVHDFSQIAHSGKIGVSKDSPAQTLLPQKYKNIQLVTVKNTDTGLQKVASGELVAFVNILPALVYSIQKQGLSNVKISGTLPSSVKLSVLVSKTNPTLVTILNKLIDNITMQERQKILNKWVQVKYEKGIDYTLSFQISIAFLFLLAILSLRYFHVHRLKSKLEELHLVLKQNMQKEIEKNQKQQLLILQQNRLVQKGEIISMIAHQWRQPLNSLSLLHQTFILKYKTAKVNEEILEDFSNTSKRLINQMSETIDDFRNFFKKEKKKVHFSVSSVINQAVSIVQPVLENENIQVTVFEEKELFYTGFPNELGQAIINIINNAKDALLQNNPDKKEIKIYCKEYLETIRIRIYDNGGGIPEEILPQIFDPYFSTKSAKQGTGLGLYMCKIIIKEHMEGKLTAINHKDGACFEILLYK